jgi:hypothetical protein
LESSDKKRGANMITQTNQNAAVPASGRTERMQDLLIVSSFGLWAVLIGLVPVLAYRLLIS